jgi:flavin reductase (DIM6/NTAB) family NADH-FMN oxidoreductase RutF
MSRSLGTSLPPELVDLLSQRDLATRLGRAIPLVTVDAEGRPHPMLSSYLECLAVDPRTVHVVIGAASRSAANLLAGRPATLLLVEPERTVYVKCRPVGPPVVAVTLARFELDVREVLEDAAAAWEEGLAITSGITYAPTPPLDAPWVNAVLALLRSSGSW